MLVELGGKIFNTDHVVTMTKTGTNVEVTFTTSRVLFLSKISDEEWQDFTSTVLNQSL